MDGTCQSAAENPILLPSERLIRLRALRAGSFRRNLTRGNVSVNGLGFRHCPGAGVVTTATAGHLEPLVTDARGHLVPSPLTPGPPLGIEKDAGYEQSESQITPGSVAALFTDGMLDARRLGTDAAIRRLAGLLTENRGEDLETLADRMVGGGHQRVDTRSERRGPALAGVSGPHTGGSPRQ
ncbi:SpoIIE family protein phosphatase [Streptomyces sp. NBC_01716]|uniref:SpoIIE family protein phosphatase n=1 Tax=Streptomyces sp. NBC_01716 TaxID=2975917 RepID=UPI003FCCAF0F